MVQFKVCRGHISFQAPEEKHQLRKNEELPVLSYFPSVVIRSPGRPRLPYRVPGEGRQLPREVRQKGKDKTNAGHWGGVAGSMLEWSQPATRSVSHRGLGLGGQADGDLKLIQLQITCVTQARFNFSVPPFPHLLHGN